jgi:hypothetical protein
VPDSPEPPGKPIDFGAMFADQRLNPNQRAARWVIFRMLETMKSVEALNQWILTGVASFLGLLVVNLEHIYAVENHGALRAGLLLLTAALLCGVTARVLILVAANVNSMARAIEKDAIQPPLQAALAGASQKAINAILAVPMGWALRYFLARGAEKNEDCPISGDLSGISMMAWGFYCGIGSLVFGLSGLFALGFGLK